MFAGAYDARFLCRLTDQVNRRVPAGAEERPPDTRPVERMVRRQIFHDTAEPLIQAMNSGVGRQDSLDHLVGAQHERLRNRDPERPRGLEIDCQLELRRLLDWNVGGLGAMKNPVHEECGTPKRL